MSLNDEVLGDIQKESLADNDVVLAPSVVPKSNVNITLIPETSDVQPLKEVEDKDLTTLPTMNVKFKLVEEGSETVATLQEVENQIVAQEGINLASAQLVNEKFGGDLFNGPVKESFFTKGLSKANYGYVANYMARKISLESQSLVANFQTLLDEPLRDVKDRLVKIQNVYMPATRDGTLEATAVAIDLKDALKVKKDLVFPVAGDAVSFVNLANADLKSLTVTKIMHEPTQAAIGQAIDTIKACLDNPDFSRLIYGIMEKRSVSSCLDRSTPDYKTNPLSLEQIVELYQNDCAYDCIKELMDHAEAQIRTLDKIQEESNKHKDTLEKIQEYLKTKGKEIRECFDCIEQFYTFINSFAMFNKASLDMMQYVKTI